MICWHTLVVSACSSMMSPLARSGVIDKGGNGALGKFVQNVWINSSNWFEQFTTKSLNSIAIDLEKPGLFGRARCVAAAQFLKVHAHVSMTFSGRVPLHIVKGPLESHRTRIVTSTPPSNTPYPGTASSLSSAHPPGG